MNLAGDYRSMALRPLTTDAGGITADHLRTTIHRTKPQS
jgi:hypothetical protein